jgi:hypothetical protein
MGLLGIYIYIYISSYSYIVLGATRMSLEHPDLRIVPESSALNPRTKATWH